MKIIGVETLLAAEPLPVIDVRSPGEFQQGHIPQAHNVPLFDDAERAEIGTLYKQVGRQQAVDRGLALAEAKAERLVQAVDEITCDSAFAVQCWRGGMRSEAFAWLCQDCGLSAQVLRGGYKSFRRAARNGLAVPQRIVVLAGHTGSGKTQLLSALRNRGQQVIDLEGLANHRGSAFGGIGQLPQPTTEQFENNLFLQWRMLDPSRIVWIEGESRAIGKVQIPQEVWDQMTEAPMIFADVARDKRVDFLVSEYGDFPPRQLSMAIERIGKRLGGERLQSALAALDSGDVRTFADQVLGYYDKSYSRALAKRPSDGVRRIPLRVAGDPAATADLIRLAAELISGGGSKTQWKLPVNIAHAEQETAVDFMFRI